MAVVRVVVVASVVGVVEGVERVRVVVAARLERAEDAAVVAAAVVDRLWLADRVVVARAMAMAVSRVTRRAGGALCLRHT